MNILVRNVIEREIEREKVQMKPPLRLNWIDLEMGKYTDRNFVDNFLQVVIYLALVANI